jgi:retinol dehydrogenase-12
MKLDLSDLTSVRKFAVDFKSKYDRLDVLMNNAGFMAKDHKETK